MPLHCLWLASKSRQRLIHPQKRKKEHYCDKSVSGHRNQERENRSKHPYFPQSLIAKNYGWRMRRMRINWKNYALPSVYRSDSLVNRSVADLAIQHRLGILPQRRFGFYLPYRVACCLTSLVRARCDSIAILGPNLVLMGGTFVTATPQRVGR